MVEWRNSKQKLILQPPFESLGGAAYFSPLSDAELAAVADTPEAPFHSLLRLFEDNVVLGPGHERHERIGEIGGGRYSHWRNGLFFSTSDNSDPNANGRVYAVDLAEHSLTQAGQNMIDQLSALPDAVARVGAVIDVIWRNTLDDSSSSRADEQYLLDHLINQIAVAASDSGGSKPNVNCLPRVLVMKEILRRMDIVSRPVRFLLPGATPDSLDIHNCLEVYLTEGKSWQCWDPLLGIGYRKLSGEPADAVDLVRLGADAVLPVGIQATGWHETGAKWFSPYLIGVLYGYGPNMAEPIYLYDPVRARSSLSENGLQIFLSSLMRDYAYLRVAALSAD